MNQHAPLNSGVPDPKSVLRRVFVPPDPAGTIHALSNAGYTAETAVADLVDNSVTAGARNITIDLQEDEGRRTLVVSDDGSGMSADRLIDAMRLCSTPEGGTRSLADLGHYGMGMKAASLHLSGSGRMSVDTLDMTK